jgi:arylsulfatase A-like enzyme
VKWPGVTEAGSFNEDLVQNLDYAETFLEMAGAEIPDDMQGRSLVPLLAGDTPDDWRESIYYHYYEYPSVHMVPRHYGVRNDRYKLMHFYQFDEWEFYDLETDPNELHNLYDDPASAEVINAMKVELERLRAHYDDDSDVTELPEAKQRELRSPSTITRAG